MRNLLLGLVFVGACAHEGPPPPPPPPPPPTFHERIVKDAYDNPIVIILEDSDRNTLCYIFVQHVSDSTGAECVRKKVS